MPGMSLEQHAKQLPQWLYRFFHANQPSKIS